MQGDLRVVREVTFDAAHSLPLHQGACKNLHGHTYRLQVGVSGRYLNEQGMVIDFADLDRIIQNEIVFHLDHAHLNKIERLNFPASAPTAEGMVLWMRERLTTALQVPNTYISLIRLWETPNSYAEWRHIP